MGMRNILIGGLLCILALLFANTFAEAAQSGWTTSIKITCDSSVADGRVWYVLLCRDQDPQDVEACNACRALHNTQNPQETPLPCPGNVVFAGNFTCGTGFPGGIRTDGGRIDSPFFEPTFFNYRFFEANGLDCG